MSNRAVFFSTRVSSYKTVDLSNSGPELVSRLQYFIRNYVRTHKLNLLITMTNDFFFEKVKKKKHSHIHIYAVATQLHLV